MTVEPRPPDLPRFYRHTALGEVASTNDEAVKLAAEGAEQGSLITARSQSDGRGRRGRIWQSPEGNLYLSLILRPADGLAAAAAITFIGALAVADAAEEILGDDADLSLKWPNDVLIGGRKIAGMMIESTGKKGAHALILGIGINIIWHPTDLPYPATDLHAEGAGEADAQSVLRVFCTHFLTRYRDWESGGFLPLRDAWMARAKGLGEVLNVEIEGRRFDGIFKGIDDVGALCLDLGPNGVKIITAGDVYFADTPRPKPC